MVSAIETNLTSNLAQIMGGLSGAPNTVLLAVVFLVIVVVLVMIARIPLIIAVPIFIFALSIAGLLVGGFLVFAGLLAGAIIGYFIFNLWRGS